VDNAEVLKLIAQVLQVRSSTLGQGTENVVQLPVFI
jgi:hypothetical protein